MHAGMPRPPVRLHARPLGSLPTRREYEHWFLAKMMLPILFAFAVILVWAVLIGLRVFCGCLVKYRTVLPDPPAPSKSDHVPQFVDVQTERSYMIPTVVVAAREGRLVRFHSWLEQLKSQLRARYVDEPQESERKIACSQLTHRRRCVNAFVFLVNFWYFELCVQVFAALACFSFADGTIALRSAPYFLCSTPYAVACVLWGVCDISRTVVCVLQHV
jgi:hypothetical protein